MKSTILITTFLTIIGTSLAQNEILNSITFEQILDVFQSRIYNRYRDCIIEDLNCDQGSTEFSIKLMLIRLQRDKNFCRNCSREQVDKAVFILCLLRGLKPEDYAKAVTKYNGLDTLISEKLCTNVLSTYPESGPVI